MRGIALLTTACALLLVQTACGGGQRRLADDFTRVLPDDRIKVTLPVDAFVGDEPEQRTVGKLSELGESAALATIDINDRTEGLFVDMTTAQDFEPSWSDGNTTATWGPWQQGEDYLAFRMHFNQRQRFFTWSLNWVHPDDTAESGNWITLVSGEIERGAKEARSTGFFTFDFDALASVDSTSEAAGLFTHSYSIDDDTGATALVFLENYKADASAEATTTTWAYEQDLEGEGWFDTWMEKDVEGKENLERLAIRSRWRADGTGRADALATGGNLGKTEYQMVECWDEDYDVVYESNTWADYSDGKKKQCAWSGATANETHEI